MVSSWSKHQSSSSSVSSASCWYCWSDSVALGLTHTPPRGDLLRTQQLVRPGTKCRLTYYWQCLSFFSFPTIRTWQAVAYRNKSSYIKVYWKNIVHVLWEGNLYKQISGHKRGICGQETDFGSGSVLVTTHVWVGFVSRASFLFLGWQRNDRPLLCLWTASTFIFVHWVWLGMKSDDELGLG